METRSQLKSDVFLTLNSSSLPMPGIALSCLSQITSMVGFHFMVPYTMYLQYFSRHDQAALVKGCPGALQLQVADTRGGYLCILLVNLGQMILFSSGYFVDHYYDLCWNASDAEEIFLLYYFMLAGVVATSMYS